MNYDVVSSIINHGITNCMNVEAQNFPVLMVENSFTAKEDKYKVMCSAVQCSRGVIFLSS